MVEPLRPARGGFLRPFGCGWFIREFLMGHGPNGSPKIDPSVGAPQSDICYHYKKALLKAIAVDRATRQEEKQAKREKRLISPDKIERLTTRYLLQTSYKSSGCRYHSFVVYFSNLQRLGWVEESGKVERLAFQDNYPREVILVSSFASLRQAELPLKLLGQTPLLPSMGSGVC